MIRSPKNIKTEIVIEKMKNLNNQSSYFGPGSNANTIPITPIPKHITSMILIIPTTSLFPFIIK